MKRCRRTLPCLNFYFIFFTYDDSRARGPDKAKLMRASVEMTNKKWKNFSNETAKTQAQNQKRKMQSARSSVSVFVGHKVGRCLFGGLVLIHILHLQLRLHLHRHLISTSTSLYAVFTARRTCAQCMLECLLLCGLS